VKIKKCSLLQKNDGNQNNISFASFSGVKRGSLALV
jgi:hypothetical protein